MEQERWIFLDRLTADNPFAVSEPVYDELAERLREAIEHKDPALVRSLSQQLTDIMRSMARIGSDDAVKATESFTVANKACSEAFSLGQIGFAQKMATVTAARRADAEFEDTVKGDQYARYIGALLEKNMTGVELAGKVGQRVETVSRTLKKLRELGIIDYRREGTSFVNFLTPAARDALGKARTRFVRHILAPQVARRIGSEHSGLPDIWQIPQHFAAAPSPTVDHKGNVLAD